MLAERDICRGMDQETYLKARARLLPGATTGRLRMSCFEAVAVSKREAAIVVIIVRCV